MQIENLAERTYEFVAGGILEGTIDVSLGRGELAFDSADPPKPVLDFSQ